MAIDAVDRATTRAICTLRTDRHRAGWIGRQLFGLFRLAGLEDVQVRSVTPIINDLGLLDRLVGIEDAARAAAENGIITAEAASNWLADLRARHAAGCFFACGMAF